MKYINSKKSEIMALNKSQIFDLFIGILKNTYKLTKQPILKISDVVSSLKRKRGSTFIVSSPKRVHLDMERQCSICSKQFLIKSDEDFNNFIGHNTTCFNLNSTSNTKSTVSSSPVTLSTKAKHITKLANNSSSGNMETITTVVKDSIPQDNNDFHDLENIRKCVNVSCDFQCMEESEMENHIKILHAMMPVHECVQCTFKTGSMNNYGAPGANESSFNDELQSARKLINIS